MDYKELNNIFNVPAGKGTVGEVYICGKNKYRGEFENEVAKFIRLDRRYLSNYKNNCQSEPQEDMEKSIAIENIINQLCGFNAGIKSKYLLPIESVSYEIKADYVDIILITKKYQSLENIIKDCCEDYLCLDDLICFSIDICDALIYLEEREQCLDVLKPTNIFRTDNGFVLGDYYYDLLNVKNCRIYNKNTYKYIAPEVYRGEEFDGRAAIYSLGLIIYQLINKGHLPFDTENIEFAGEEIANVRRLSGEPVEKPKIEFEGWDEAEHCNLEKLLDIALKACSFKKEERYLLASEMRNNLILLKYKSGNIDSNLSYDFEKEQNICEEINILENDMATELIESALADNSIKDDDGPKEITKEIACEGRKRTKDKLILSKKNIEILAISTLGLLLVMYILGQTDQVRTASDIYEQDEIKNNNDTCLSNSSQSGYVGRICEDNKDLLLLAKDMVDYSEYDVTDLVLDNTKTSAAVASNKNESNISISKKTTDSSKTLNEQQNNITESYRNKESKSLDTNRSDFSDEKSTYAEADNKNIYSGSKYAESDNKNIFLESNVLTDEQYSVIRNSLKNSLVGRQSELKSNIAIYIANNNKQKIDKECVEIFGDKCSPMSVRVKNINIDSKDARDLVNKIDEYTRQIGRVTKEYGLAINSKRLKVGYEITIVIVI